MNKLKKSTLMLMMLAAAPLAPAAFGQSKSQPPSSAASSPRSVTRADDDNLAALGACAAAVDELVAVRRLVEVQAAQIELIKERLETEKRSSAASAELAAARAAEATALRAALAAKDDVILAKTAELAARNEIIDQLKKKNGSPLRRLGDILLGAAVFAILK